MMKTKILMLVVIAAGLLSSCSNKPSPEKFASEWCAKYQKGVKYMDEKKFEEANASFEEMDKYYQEVTKKYAGDPEFLSNFKSLSKKCADEHRPIQHKK